MGTRSQANQSAQISVLPGLVADDLLLERFVATERLSIPFEIIIEVLSEKVIDFQAHLGQGVGIRALTELPLVDRFFHGILFEAQTLESDIETNRYRLTLRPWLSLLDMGLNTRIFQHQSVQDIIKKVFADAGMSGFSMNMDKAGSDQREYCVQYRESDFHFVSRLMEEEGIYYYFAHAESAHKMMLCDSPGNHPAFANGLAEVRPQHSGGGIGPHVWSFEKRVKPAIIKATLFDAHFQQTTTVLQASTAEASVNAAEAAEHYDFPGRFGYFKDDGSEKGTAYVATRLAQARTERETYFARGDVFAFPVGQKVIVKANTTITALMIVSATHQMGVQTYMGSGEEDPPEYHVEFEGVPADLQWKAPLVTEKPLAGGPQVATVVGQAGEVVDVDKFGRVKIQFPWDRIGKNDEKSSCWVRVSQGWADGGFGQIMLPRIGEEVIVDFLDGDLDRPIITGRVYNSALTVPYPLPAEKTKSTWKSQTIGTTGPYPDTQKPPTGTGFNEIRFEDKGGSEEVYLHAQRDLKSEICFDEDRFTGHNTTVVVGYNRDVTVTQDESLTVKNGNATRTIELGNEKHTVTAGSRTTTVHQDDSTTVEAGDYKLTVSDGQATLEASKQITLKVGPTTLTMKPDSIELSTTNITFTANADLKATGLNTTLEASVMNTIKGTLVKIN